MHTPTTLLLSMDSHDQYRHADIAEDIDIAMIEEIKILQGEMFYFMVICGG